VAIETYITSLDMSDGSSVSVPPGGVLVFVGPNNAGKSVALRDVRSHVAIRRSPPLAVKGAQVHGEGEQNDLEAWVEKHCHKVYQDGEYRYQRMGQGPYELASLAHYWQQGPPYNIFGEMLVFFAGGEERLGAANGTGNIDFLREPPVHPLHYLYQDPELEKKVSDICMRAFGAPLVLNRYAGSMVYLHVGEAPATEPGALSPSREYMEALGSMPRLDEQGDGMKSFMGLLLNLTASAHPFVLVDEPEAFLHPPQARLMGRMLGDEKGPDAQVFVATHDSDVLRGLLDSSDSKLTVVRLVRHGNVNRSSQLEPERVRELWRDPLLRYSNILDGLFHDGVVLCEADADCRFYQAVLDPIAAGEPESRRSDLLFTHCGGKARMATVIEALRAVDVPVRTVADFDVLREKEPLKSIVQSLGGEWASVEDHWRVLKSALDSATKKVSTDYLRERMLERLDAIETPSPTDEDDRRIRALLKERSGGWANAKEYGARGVPAGDAADRLERMLSYLRDVGLFVVPEGELEGFARGVPGHGPAWVNGVLERGLHADGSLKEARDFAATLAASF
jgi:hypothetical protein